VADDHGGPMSPARAFAVCAVLAATAGALELSAGPDRLPATTAPGAAVAAPSPTDSPGESPPPNRPFPGRPETLFRRLRAGLNLAVRDRSVHRLRAVTAPGPVRRRGAQVIRGLLRDDVIEGTRVVTTDIRVARVLAGGLVIAEKVRLRPCFRTESGRDITRAPALVAQRGVWTLLSSGGEWRLRAARITTERVVNDARARCP
jgi:hypothetical protein